MDELFANSSGIPRLTVSMPIGARVSLPDAQMYRVVGGSDEGGMANILFCENPVAQPAALAIKICRNADNPREVARFRWEAQAWISLGAHASIVEAYHVFRHGGVDMIAMQLIKGHVQFGPNLRGWIRGGGLDLSRTLAVALEICDGIQYASAQSRRRGGRFVHRDLKPENVLITETGHAKVTDFGIVQMPHESTPGILGTAGYMSPEQWRGEDLDERSDVYSLGCVLYEMLTGSRVFDSTTWAEDRRLHCLAEPMPPSRLHPRSPGRLDAVVLRCLSKRREERPADFSILRSELERAASDLHLKTSPAAAVPRPAPDELERRALSLLVIDAPQEAVRLLEDTRADWAHTRDVYYPSLVECRGLARARSGDLVEGVQDLRAALVMRPRSARGLLFLGETLLLAGEIGEAEECLGQSAAIDPSSAMSYAWLSHLHLVRGELKQAQVMAARAVTIDSYSGLARAYRALAFLRDPTFGPESARREAGAALDADSTVPMAYVVRACAWLRAGHRENAEQELGRAIACLPNRAYRSLAEYLLAVCAGRREEARAMRQRCREMSVLSIWQPESDAAEAVWCQPG